MSHALRSYLTAAIAIAGVNLIAVSPITPPRPAVQVRAVHLTGSDTPDSPLGDGTALVIGPSGIPIPPQTYLDAAYNLYLQPRGFDGTTQGLATPESLYPVTGVKSLLLDPSIAQGQQILDSAILGQIPDDGQAILANPVVVFGFSQSSTISSLTMSQLASQDVPSDDVHFVLVGDPNNPDGGLLERFDVPAGTNPSVPSLGITFSGATPSDLYPTDIYTNEYDGFADFPRYPIDPLSDINALLGILYQHVSYMNLDPEDAFLLPGSAELTGEGLTNYYMIPDDGLPLLEPLRLIPFFGQPLYDLLEPDMSVLVNLGYGCISDSWCEVTDASTPTPFGLFPTDLNWVDVLTALVKGVPQGIEAAFKDLLNPDNYKIAPIVDNPSLAPLVQAAYTFGLTDDPHASLFDLVKGALSNFAHFPISDTTLLSPPTDIINDFTATISADYASLLPVADTFNALLTTLPAVGLDLIWDQLKEGHLLDAIGLPIAAAVALIPFAFIVGIGAPILEAAGGTLINLIDLFNFG